MGMDLRSHGFSDTDPENKLFWGAKEYIDVVTLWKYLQTDKGFKGNKIGNCYLLVPIVIYIYVYM